MYRCNMKRQRLILTSILSALLVMFSGLQATSAQATQTLSVEGVEFTWPDEVYAPQSLEESTNSYLQVNYSNKAGSDFYYIGYSMNEPNGTPFPVFNLKVGVKNGSTGVLQGKMSFMYFLNFTGPGSYPITLCVTKALGATEVCGKSTVTFVTVQPTVPKVTVKPPTTSVKKTITCKKGATTKKVTAANPKCPKGWVKK
jgi:hypothetical protein